MSKNNASFYEHEVPADAIVLPTYEGSSEQVEALRAALKELTKGHDGAPERRLMSVPQLLREAGLNTPGGLSYDQSALARFIDGSTSAPNPKIVKQLYEKWINSGKSTINLAAIENVFYHGALIAMDVNAYSQAELAKLLAGHFFFYKKSALNPDFFVRGLLTVVARHNVVHVTELQYHKGGDGMPETEEVDEGFAIMKGNIIYIISRSKNLKGATFTVINHHPVRTNNKSVYKEEITTLFGHQIGGREFTPPTSSPYVAERITLEEAVAARRDRKKGDSILGFCEQVPKLLERHLRYGSSAL